MRISDWSSYVCSSDLEALCRDRHFRHLYADVRQAHAQQPVVVPGDRAHRLSLGEAAMIRLARDQRGAAAIEFVLAVPPFIMLLMGALQLGIIACARTGLQHAVDEGARYASLFPTPSHTDNLAKLKSRQRSEERRVGKEGAST